MVVWVQGVCSCTYSIVVSTFSDKVLCYTCSDHSLVVETYVQRSFAKVHHRVGST